MKSWRGEEKLKDRENVNADGCSDFALDLINKSSSASWWHCTALALIVPRLMKGNLGGNSYKQV